MVQKPPKSIVFASCTAADVLSYRQALNIFNKPLSNEYIDALFRMGPLGAEFATQTPEKPTDPAYMAVVEALVAVSSMLENIQSGELMSDLTSDALKKGYDLYYAEESREGCADLFDRVCNKKWTTGKDSESQIYEGYVFSTLYAVREVLLDMYGPFVDEHGIFIDESPILVPTFGAKEQVAPWEPEPAPGPAPSKTSAKSLSGLDVLDLFSRLSSLNLEYLVVKDGDERHVGVFIAPEGAPDDLRYNPSTVENALTLFRQLNHEFFFKIRNNTLTLEMTITP